MTTLKGILDGFGWDTFQQKDTKLPPEILVKGYRTTGETAHKYDLYACNGVFVITEDDGLIIDLSGIAKVGKNYERRVQMPGNCAVELPETGPNVAEFLKGFKHLHSFNNTQVFIKDEGMNFQGIGQRVEKAGLLYSRS